VPAKHRVSRSLNSSALICPSSSKGNGLSSAWEAANASFRKPELLTPIEAHAAEKASTTEAVSTPP